MPAAAGAVKSPAELIVPPPAFQLNAGGVAIACWNWSNPWAENCLLAPAWTPAVPGVTRMLLSICATVTARLLVTDKPALSTIFTAMP